MESKHFEIDVVFVYSDSVRVWLLLMSYSCEVSFLMVYSSSLVSISSYVKSPSKRYYPHLAVENT